MRLSIDIYLKKKTKEKAEKGEAEDYVISVLLFSDF